MSEKGEPVFAAITSRDIPQLRRCLEDRQGLEVVNEYGRAPLLQAALLGYDDVVSQILRSSPLLEASDEDGNTALILAATFDRVAVVTQLLHAGANVHGRNPFTGETALIAAPGAVSASSCPDCLNVLLTAGADVNVQNADGISALMRAANSNRAVCAIALLKAGANIDLVDSKGRTALFHAVRYDSSDVCALLIQKGANANLADANHVTPRMLAETSTIPSIRALFGKATG